MSPEPQNVKECFHGSSQIVGKCHIICDFFWNISRWSAKTPKYQGSLNSPSLLTFKISLSDLQWILIVSRWVAKTPLVLGRFSRSSAKLQNFQINSTDYINAIVALMQLLLYAVSNLSNIYIRQAQSVNMFYIMKINKGKIQMSCILVIYWKENIISIFLWPNS